MGLQHRCGALDIPISKAVAWCIPPAIAVFTLFAIYRFLRYRNRFQVRDKVVLITGASSGIGKCCSKVFYQNGAKVILASRSEQNLIKVKEELKTLCQGHEPDHVIVDMNDYDSIKEAARKVLERHGRVDILINNAGQSFRGDAIETDIAVHERLMKINYFGQIVLTQAVLPGMIRNREGHIVVVSSLQGKIAVPFRTAYGATKHALECYFNALRAELYENNIRVLVVCPGYTKTALPYHALVGDGTHYGKLDDTIAAGMEPDYVAEEIHRAVQYDEKHILLGPFHHVVGCYLGNTCWNLMAYIMRKRVKKERAEKNKSQ